jgi:hypothetical protein
MVVKWVYCWQKYYYCSGELVDGSFLLLVLFICSDIGDEKGVLKVNRAEERGGTKFSSELNVETKYGHIWYFFCGTIHGTKIVSEIKE